MADLKEALSNALKAAAGASATPKASAERSSQPDEKGAATQEPVDIRIGFDFGTRWTKVAYSLDDGRPIRHVFKNPTAEQPFFPTQMFVTPNEGFRVFSQRHNAGSEAIALPYLKLFLRNRDQPFIPLAGKVSDRISTESIRALSAHFFAVTLRFALDQIELNEKHRLEGGLPRYWLNVSIPADHFNPQEQDVFRDVAAVGLSWATSDAYPSEGIALSELEESYVSTVRALEPRQRERIGVIPEIVAALVVFLSRRDTPDGLHGFIDVGAGTLDGCVFHFRRGTNGAPPEIDILSSRVENLGSAILSLRAVRLLQNEVGELVEKPLVIRSEAGNEFMVELPLKDLSADLAQFAGYLSATAFRKRPLPTVDRKLNTRNLEQQGVYFFHMAGGAASSPFYVAALEAARANKFADTYGCLPYRCRATPVESVVDGTPDTHFSRTLIAAGLTRSADDLGDIGLKLPHEIAEATPLPMREILNSYADSKDWT